MGHVMSDPRISRLYEVSVVQPANSTLHSSTLHYVAATAIFDFASQGASLVSLWKLVVILFVFVNVKNFPLIWHVSISVNQHP